MKKLNFRSIKYKHSYRKEIDQNMKLVQKLNTGKYTPKRIRRFLNKITGEKLDKSVSIKLPFVTDFGGNIHFGKNIIVNTGVMFTDLGGIFLGDNVLIGPHASIITVNHSIDPGKRNILELKSIHIADNVWIGANATILPGVTIGKNSIVAAAAVVTHDVAENTIVGGIPARQIKKL